MIIALVVCIAIVAGCGAYYRYKFVTEKKKREKLEVKLAELISKQIPAKDLQFLEFTVDMYVKYAKDLNIYSESQHDYIVNELERIRTEYLQLNQ